MYVQLCMVVQVVKGNPSIDLHPSVPFAICWLEWTKACWLLDTQMRSGMLHLFCCACGKECTIFIRVEYRGAWVQL